MLTKSKTPKKVTFVEPQKTGDEIAKILSVSKPVTTQKPMTQQEINQRLGLILSDD